MDCGTLRLVPRECRTSREGELSMSTAPTRDLRPLAGRAAATPSWPEQSCARGSNRRNAGAASGPKRTTACRSQRERARHGGDTSFCATRCSTRAYGRSTPFRMPTNCGTREVGLRGGAPSTVAPPLARFRTALALSGLHHGDAQRDRCERRDDEDQRVAKAACDHAMA